jgi:hypothetical protein
MTVSAWGSSSRASFALTPIISHAIPNHPVETFYADAVGGVFDAAAG